MTASVFCKHDSVWSVETVFIQGSVECFSFGDIVAVGLPVGLGNL